MSKKNIKLYLYMKKRRFVFKLFDIEANINANCSGKVKNY